VKTTIIITSVDRAGCASSAPSPPHPSAAKPMVTANCATVTVMSTPRHFITGRARAASGAGPGTERV
jgi:hypothetical protein